MLQTKFNYNHVFNELQDYMFSNEFIYKFSNKSHTNEFINKKNKRITNDDNIKNNKLQDSNKENNVFFSPHEKDKLFWCFYILHMGIEQYQFIKTISFKTEKEFKFKTAEKIKEHKDTFKVLKLKINELQDEFINQPCISIKGLIALCHIYKINLLYIKKRTYYEIISNDDINGNVNNKINIIIDNTTNSTNSTNNLESTNNIIYIPFNVTDEAIQNYKNNFWKLENFNNILKSINSYTLSELQTISNKLSIEIYKGNKKMTKQELYEKILQVL
jgi:hypothetical protein